MSVGQPVGFPLFLGHILLADWFTASSAKDPKPLKYSNCTRGIAGFSLHNMYTKHQDIVYFNTLRSHTIDLSGEI